MRIGKNEAADGAVFRGDFWLNAAPGAVVARDDDGAFHGNTHALELFVIIGNAKIDVDERSGDVAINRIGVVRGKLLGLSDSTSDLPTQAALAVLP